MEVFVSGEIPKDVVVRMEPERSNSSKVAWQK
jgi:hypothetical protein